MSGNNGRGSGYRYQLSVLGLALLSLTFIAQESQLQKPYKENQSLRSTSRYAIQNSSNDSPPPTRIPRLINDATLYWNETMIRPWVSFFEDNTTIYDKVKHPPFMILLTNVGWNHPNQTDHGLTLPRFKRERELMEGIINHPYFHPTAWEEINKGSMPILGNRNDTEARVNYYVFADVMQCTERNYPVYGGTQNDNLDPLYNRSVDESHLLLKVDNCGSGKEFGFFNHPLFETTGGDTKTSRGKLVAVNCAGDGPQCGKSEHEYRISMANVGGHFPNMKLDNDQGMLPPAVNPVVLSRQEEDAIASCQADTDLRNRPIQALYVGNMRNGLNTKFHDQHTGGARMAYESLHDPEAGLIFMEGPQLAKMENEHTNISIHLKSHSHTNMNASNDNSTMIHELGDISYKKLMRSAKFTFVPRGDNKFSYRFTEALSAGGIPVYHGDNFMLPLRPELVDWNKCGIILPEKDAGQKTLDRIAKLDSNTICAMRQYCYFGIYKKYAVTPTKQIDGIVQGLDALARRKEGPKQPAGIMCNETSIASLDCNPMR